MTDTETLLAIATILISFASCVGSIVMSGLAVCVTWWGLNEWKTQKKFDAHYDIARRLSALALKFQDNFSRLQFIAYLRPQSEYETPEQTEVFNITGAHLKRLQFYSDIVSEMQAINWESKATIANDFSSNVQSYKDVIGEITRAIYWLTPKMYEYVKANESLRTKLAESEDIINGTGKWEALQMRVKNNTDELMTKLGEYTFTGSSTGNLLQRVSRWSGNLRATQRITRNKTGA